MKPLVVEPRDPLQRREFDFLEVPPGPAVSLRISVIVSDIVGTNQELFSFDSSTCRHITSIRSGNNVLDSGEACDNGANCVGGATPGALCDASGLNTCGAGTCERAGGDGCNRACRVESGWSCSGSPSVCTQP